MILHFLTDDKFSEYVLKQFAKPEADSDFVVVSDSESLDHLKQGGVRVISPGSGDFEEIIAGLSKYKAIVLHGLFWPWQAHILEQVPEEVKVAWVFWGGEIYGRQDVQTSFLACRTRFIYQLHRVVQVLKGKVSRDVYEIPKELFSRVNYCLTDIDEEYQYALSYLGNNMKHLWYNYYSIEDTLGETIDCPIRGDNVLVGHSGTIEGNHEDVFCRIKKYDLGDRQVISPVSYGKPWVINWIIKRGHQRFGKSFIPIKEFIPRKDYNHVLLGCSFVIMNHYRPQALGNIITALWMGARVYMSVRSMQFHYLKRKGIVLFSIEKDLMRDIKCPSLCLPYDQVIYNRRVLTSIYGRQASREKVYELVSVLNS